MNPPAPLGAQCFIDASYYKITTDGKTWRWNPDFKEWQRSTKTVADVRAEVKRLGRRWVEIQSDDSRTIY